ncbi:MAG: glycosyltransferase family 9 protein [Candidatus Omnitrophica bacterium]|nr:glycosyltransferase family 9 protein [Candidatus Omnitrophota bacterium]
MNKFLIINPFGIGDVLFTAPVIRAVKDRHPGSFIGYWSNERVGELLISNPKIDRVFALSRGDIKRIYKNSPLKRLTALFKLINDIRKERFDVAFDFSLDSRYGLWSKLAGIKKRIGLDYKNRGRFLTDKVKLAGYSGEHVVEHNLELLKFIGINASSPGLDEAINSRTGRGCTTYSLEVSEEASARAKKILIEHGVAAADLLIGVAPGGGASWGKNATYKQWPAQKFAELADRLIKDSNVKVVLLGSIEEKPLVEIVEKIVLSCPRKRASINDAPLDSRWSLPRAWIPVFAGMTRGGNDNEPNQAMAPTIVNLTGRLSLKELAAIISELKLLICNDGGPLHMAVALGVKTVSIFGPVDEKVYGPYPPGAKHIVVKKDLPCRPCYRDFRFTGCSNNHRCLEDITVNEVYDSVSMSLEER